MNELDVPLGLDGTGQDRVRNQAAVAVFALTVLAILGGGIGWFALGKGAVEPPGAETGAAPDFAAAAAAAVPVAADAPVLRQELHEDSSMPSQASNAARSITIIDGKTGRRETILLGSGADEDDTADGLVPAAASGDVAPKVLR